MENYEVNLATKEDAKQILKLLKEVAVWLKGAGSKQWETLASGEEDEELIQSIAEKYAYVVKREKRIVATFTLYPKQSDWDEWLWGKENEPAVYLHKLALKPSEMGNGLGENILKWLQNHLKDNGMNKLRLDCIASNEKLNNFYARNGFEKVNISKEFSLFEKELS